MQKTKRPYSTPTLREIDNPAIGNRPSAKERALLDISKRNEAIWDFYSLDGILKQMGMRESGVVE